MYQDHIINTHDIMKAKNNKPPILVFNTTSHQTPNYKSSEWCYS